ncbi:PepSY domain-containing protein [Dysgonomonas sp. UBA7630]|uniref:PepSY domain-containing protein n=1 Tax=Dysgonomonas sp. UBA7630 TaxID=1946426 RepID=UPI0025B7A99B|nr:PepSY domain-containing protein [Dysgonomonas sp. UBA7630]
MTFKKIAYQLHLYLGLISGLVFFIVCLTGAIWALKLNGWVDQEKLPEVSQGKHTTVVRPSSVIEVAKKEFKDKTPDYIEYSEDAPIKATFRGQGYNYSLQMDPYTGKVISVKGAEGSSGYDFWDFIGMGHFSLWLPYSIGQPIVGYSTLVFVIVIITGLILWMSHPAWPSMIWQTYTYDYETPGSYFGAKKACEPIHIQMNLPENDVMIINTTLNDYKSVTAGLRFIDFQGKELYKKNIKLDAKANSATKCFVPEKGNNLPQLYLARLELKDAKGKVLSINDYWMTNGDKKSYEAINTLPSTTVTIKTISNKGKTWVEVSNPSKTLAVAVKLNVVDKNSKEILLPAYFSDGYINLLGGEKRLIELDIPKSITNYSIVAEGYNTKSK